MKTPASRICEMFHNLSAPVRRISGRRPDLVLSSTSEGRGSESIKRGGFKAVSFEYDFA